MEVFNYWLDDNDNVKELELVRKFKSRGVVKERVELYRDFSINLLNYIYDTYLGREYLNKDEDITGHFNWAYQKVLNEFEQEEIDFYGNNVLYEYFYDYYYNQFYTFNKIHSLNTYEKFWNDIFELKKSKERKVFDVLLELYEIFDKSFIRLELHKEFTL